MIEENELLQNTVDNLRERTLVLEKQCHEKDLQMALLSVETCSLREENERMRAMADVREPSEQLQSAIRDRDEAIAK
ncbi:hypothetical protein GOODEAATRI_000976 [Goodea atripinnis]|uniref:Uncharacterized protein n=1 Tax=Goodea atripinnis TaxID=208336 RepID=A0ABV0N6X3_9TELE